MVSQAEASTLWYADVLIDALPEHIEQHPFTYQIPPKLKGRVRKGSSVCVPFGSQIKSGYVVNIHNIAPHLVTRPIQAVMAGHFFEEPYLEWLQWTANYYGSTLANVMSTAIPSGMLGRLHRQIKPTVEPDVFLDAIQQLFPTDPNMLELGEYLVSSAPDWKSLNGCKKRLGRQVTRSLKNLRTHHLIENETTLLPPQSSKKEQLFVTFLRQPDGLSKRQLEVLTRLRAEGGYMQASHLCKKAKTTMGLIKNLATIGSVLLETGRIMRQPLPQAIQSFQALQLSKHQQAALTYIDTQRQTSHHLPEPVILLHGITGSGKTEIYMRVINNVLKEGGGALFLVPEISLTPMILERLRHHFGERVAILHSGLSSGERLDEWQRIRGGLARIVIGARSAIFAHIPHLRLIVIDEEHETSYKQDAGVRYDARTLAIERMKRENGLVILGSATPRIESLYLAKQETYGYFCLPERISNRPLPPVSIVDMRGEAQRGNHGIFSRGLKSRITHALAEGEQVILFLNRRGYASSVLCRACGEAVKCHACSVSLTYHRSEDTLKCHYCGFLSPLPARCPHCQNPAIRQFGLGTQKVEKITQQLFPQARILRMDRDTTATKDAHFKIFQQFATGQANVLIGTQMVAKGLDFPNVTVVGILAADLALTLPDFRAGERTMQLLTQAAGRAGRGDKSSRIVIQTYAPEHPAVTFAVNHDFQGFYEQELAFRQILNYPPFCSLIKLTFCHVQEREALKVAMNYVADLREQNSEGLTIMGPLPAPIARIQNLYRVNLLLKCQTLENIRPVLIKLNRVYYAQLQRLIFDVDPYHML